MTKEEILGKYDEGYITQPEVSDVVERHNALKAMDEYAKVKAMEFFKWYGVKMVNFLEYIKDIRPIVISDELEEKIQEFEGRPLSGLYELFIQSQRQ